MKKLFLTLALSGANALALAQGRIDFANLGAGLDAPVTEWDGNAQVGLAGWAFMADLFWAPGVVTDSTQLGEFGAPAWFATNGYFFGGPRTIPGVAAGTTITVQVRVWDTFDGASWNQAISSWYWTLRIGWSELRQITLTEPPDAPAPLTGLMPFSVFLPLLDLPFPPGLSISSASADTVVLSWSVANPYYGTFTLQQNPDLTTTNWVSVTNPPVWVWPRIQVSVPNPGGTRFYRLVRTQF